MEVQGHFDCDQTFLDALAYAMVNGISLNISGYEGEIVSVIHDRPEPHRVDVTTFGRGPTWLSVYQDQDHHCTVTIRV